MATLTRKKKSIDKKEEGLTRGANSSSTSDSKVINNTSVKSTKDTNRDFSILDAYVEKEKRDSFNAPNVKNVLPYNKDEKTISTYESIPDYNVIERMFDKSKSEAYDKKQSMLQDYKDAKNRTVGKYLSQNGITSDELEALSAGTLGNKAIAGINTINMFVDWYKKESAMDKLKSIENKNVSASDILEYANSLSRDKEIQDMSDFADEHKVLGTAVTFPLNAAGGLSGLISNTANYVTGKPIDTDSYANHYTNLTNQMRDSVSDDMGDAGKFLYGVGTSIGDNLTSLALTGGHSGGAALLQGSQAFTNSVIDTANRGLDPNQIMATSTVAGAAEIMFEKLSLDNLKGIAKGGTAAEAGKSLFKQILGQMKTEAGEEMATEVVNEIADRVINKDLSNFVQSVEQYQNTGMTEEEAKSQAWKDLGNRIAYSGAAGAVSGGIMGGGAAMYNRVGGNAQNATNINENAEQSTADQSTNLLDNQVDAHTENTSPTEQSTTNDAEVGNVPNAESTTDSTEAINSTSDSTMVERIKAARAANNAQLGNQRVRGYNETLINKTDAPQELKNEFINNPDIYTQLSNAETSARADAVLANSDIYSALTQYRSMLDSKDPAAIPLGYNLSKQLSQAGRFDESVQLVRDMSKALTESGQFSQAAAITMLDNDPEAAKRYLVREIDTLNQKGRESYGGKWTDFELTESELQQFNEIESGDTDAISSLYEEVYNRLRKQYPSTMTEKLMEFRRISMLLNVRTNVRNVVSNAMLMPVRWTADRVSALGEGVYSLINPKYQRTQSLNPIRSKGAKNLASQAFETVKTELLGDNKYKDAKGAVRDKQVFKGSKVAQMLDTITNGAVTKANQAMGKDVNPSLLETARNFTYYLLEKGDDVFVRKNFESRMASYLDAQGITELENIPADAYTLATQEALKATFKDDSALANTMSSFRQLLNRLPGHFVGDAVMPFTTTPANLAMRGIDYSPAGALNGIKTLKNAKSNADVSKAITQLGQAATGTAAIALGYVLAEAGLISGALSEDKDEAQFQKQQGQLAYSIKIGDNYFSYDWAQPASIPLILGVTIYDSVNNDKDFINGLKQGTLAAVDSWLELSPLQNLSDIFGGYGTPAENVFDVLATDLPLSFIPAQLGAAAKIEDTTQRVSYDQNSYWNNLVNQAKLKIPGLSETLPVAYDTWGNPIQRQDSTSEAAIANLLNPGQFGNASITPIDDEISELYDATGDASVFPKKASWSYQINGESVKLDNEQYSEFQKIMGKNSYDMASALIDSDMYKKLSDEQRVEVISDMYSFADALAKSEVLGYDVANSDTYKRTYSVYKEKGAEGVATYFGIKQSLSGSTMTDKVDAVNSLKLSDEDKGYYLNIFDSNTDDSYLKKIDEIKGDYGYEGLYDWYTIKSNIPADKQNNATKVTAVASMDITDEEKGYYLSKLISTLSKSAQAAYDESGYAGIYWHYEQETRADRIKSMREQSDAERIKELRSQL